MTQVWMRREIMHAMWKPQKFKAIYLFATLYVLTLTLPSASAVYWAFGDMLLNHSNAFSLLPHSPFRDMAVILMLIHQVASYIYILDSSNIYEVYICMIMICTFACSSSRLGSPALRYTLCGRS